MTGSFADRPARHDRSPELSGGWRRGCAATVDRDRRSGAGSASTEAFATATDDYDGVFLSVDIDVCLGHARAPALPSRVG